MWAVDATKIITAEGKAAQAKAATEASFSIAIQAMLNAKAQEPGHSFDSIATAVTYRDDPNPSYAADGKALFDWRSAVWTYVYAQLAAVTAGTRPQPAVADFVSEVETQCPFAWPAASGG